jgi:KDO2-lipid IV(A) lauroyltransferase
MLFDRPLERGGVQAEFFGAPVRVPDGPARLALGTGAALVPAAFPRLRGAGPAVTTLADFSIDTTPSGDESADVARLTREILAAHERFIEARPDQWYMFRRMWPPAAARGRRR